MPLARLASIPSVPLGHLPSPVEKLERLRDALGGGPLEPVLEDPVHAARLTRAGSRLDVPRPDQATETEGDEDECEPAERGGLPVRGAPAIPGARSAD